MTFSKLMNNPNNIVDEIYSELVTIDTIPDRLGTWEPASLKAKKDKLYKKRLKQNPDLKKNIKKIGESMKTLITFSSKESSAISRQWHLLFTLDDKSWNSWDISDIKISNSTYSFTLEAYGKDQMLEDSYLNSVLVSDVTYTKTVRECEIEKEERIFESLLNNSIDLEIDPEKLADLLLADEPVFEAKMTIDLQVIDVDNALKHFKGTGINAKPHPKLDDEIILSFNSKDKPKLIKHLNKMGWDKSDIEDLYPELLEASIDIPKHIPNWFKDEVKRIKQVHTRMKSGSQISKVLKSAGYGKEADEINIGLNRVLRNINKLQKNIPILEAEQPDDEDGESDTIDDVQSMLTKMLPKTKNLKLGADKEKELKATLSKAMSLMGETRKKIETSMDYPQFQFAVMVPRDNYQFAAKILNDSNIKAKTQFHQGEMAIIGFDLHQETGDGKPNVSEDEVIEILNKAGIAATSTAGMEFTNEPVSIEIEE